MPAIVAELRETSLTSFAVEHVLSNPVDTYARRPVNALETVESFFEIGPECHELRVNSSFDRKLVQFL